MNVADMTMLDRALDLVSKGFHVFPVAALQKSPPLIADFPHHARNPPRSSPISHIMPVATLKSSRHGGLGGRMPTSVSARPGSETMMKGSSSLMWMLKRENEVISLC